MALKSKYCGDGVEVGLMHEPSALDELLDEEEERRDKMDRNRSEEAAL